MRAYWKVFIQPPGNVASSGVNEFVGLSYVEAEKYLKPRVWFSAKKSIRPRFQAVPTVISVPNNEYDFTKMVTKIDIEQSDRKADVCKISMYDPHNIFANMLETGLLVTVIGGWEKEESYGTLFEGIIHQVQPTFKAGQNSTLDLICLSDMVIMGLEEVDTPMINESGEADDTGEGMEEASNPEQGSYPEIIKAIAKRNHLKCDDSDIMLVPPFPKNTTKSPKQGPKQTDLARLFELADELYAAVWLEGDRLKFASLTKIFDTFKSEMTFVFRDIDNGTDDFRGIHDSIFESAATKLIYVNNASVSSGRPRKKVKVEADSGKISSVDVHGAPTKTKEGFEIVGWRPDEKKLAALSIEQQDELRAYVSPGNISAGRVEWDKIKEYVVAIVIEHKPESQTVLGTNKEKPKVDERILNIGVAMDIPAGYWKLRPISVADIAGLGQKFSGRYYVSTVTHNISQTGYSCRVEGLKVGVQNGQTK
jgi:hypothetical protein